MRRLCIYVTYDHENTVDDYIGYMLREMRKIVDHLVVVCNYQCIVCGEENVQPFADEIFYRKNIGLDAGAYKDMLCRYLGWEVIRGYDELLLVNDSFYGPLFPFRDLIGKIEGLDVDYWGMTKCPKGKLFNGYQYEPHIQSYFLALRKNILADERFRLFWEKMEQPQSLIQAVMIFELGLNRFLQESKYKGIAAMELCPSKINGAEGEIPYMLYARELIQDAGIPVLKRRSLDLENKGFENALEALRYIDHACDYDSSMIIRHLLRYGRGCNVMSLDSFYAKHPRVYIYGAGVYGRRVAAYFTYRRWHFEKFLVSDDTGVPENCIAFDVAEIAENDGIIIAVGSEMAFQEILDLVETRYDRNQIFNPWGIIR